MRKPRLTAREHVLLASAFVRMIDEIETLNVANMVASPYVEVCADLDTTEAALDKLYCKLHAYAAQYEEV